MNMPRLIGTLSVHPDGYGFVALEGEKRPDLFIPPRFLATAMQGDRVEAEMLQSSAPASARGGREQRGRRDAKGNRHESSAPAKEKPTGKTEARITQVLERAAMRVVGVFDQQGRDPCVFPDDRRIREFVRIVPDGTSGARHGQHVAVQILTYPGSKEGFTGKVIQILGARGELTTEIDAVIHHHGLPTEFSREVMASVENVRAEYDAACKNLGTRRDLRALPFVTIDGETAKDFDDAIYVESLEQQGWKVYVAIADVTFFVKPGMPVDTEARARGTSTYFPDRALPMLPHTLSDDLCSLRPGENRLVLVAEFTVHPDGTMRAPQVYRGLIRSHARLTYTQVHAMIDERKIQERRDFAAVLPMVETAAACARCLRTKRHRRGSIDFDLPEPQIILDLQGEPENIIRAPRYFAHQLIEEMMIAANETVAQFLVRKQFPCVFRVHPEPTKEKMQQFADLLRELRCSFVPPVPPKAKDLARVVESVRGTDVERLVNHTLLRAMQQAVYDTTNIGHFGLASTCYCHFTSPIRRYPDILTHRLLLAAIGDAPKSPDLATLALQGLAEQSTRRERVSMHAEREMAKVYAALFLKARIGETYEGIVSHIAAHGAYVELCEYFVEGLVSKSSLATQSATPSPTAQQGKPKKPAKPIKTPSRELHVGEKVTVTVAKVDVEARQIDFRLV